MDNAIDTLFIDEGFGTLDGTYLPKVLEALEKLHANEGKKIGIISLVKLLRDRIPTKIKISPEGTKSTIEVINEKTLRQRDPLQKDLFNYTETSFVQYHWHVS